jgi:hypothetical protein
MGSAYRKSEGTPNLFVRDQRGAIMVMGVVMAVFLVAVLYYLVGIGDALLHRQRMQDAADAAAFSSAVVHARGMNVIVLINMIMAALLAIVVALKMVETLLAAAIVLIGIASIFTGGTLASLIPPLESARKNANTAAEGAKKAIFPQLQVLHTTARAVRAVVPAASEIRVVDTVAGHYAPPAQIGLAIPSRLTLPTTNGEFAKLCEKAGRNVGEVVALPFKEISGDVGDLLGDVIGNATEGLAGSLNQWFCGPGDPSFKGLDIEYTEKYPTLDSRKKCSKYSDRSRNDGYDPKQHEKLCELAIDEEKKSKPDDEGYCKYEEEPRKETLCEPYWKRAEAAREQCDPNETTRLVNYWWQERTVRLHYEKTSVGWIPRREIIDVELAKNGDCPCGKDSWNRIVGKHDSVKSHPVCSEEHDAGCEGPPDKSLDGDHEVGDTTEPCEFIEIAQVFGCEKKDKTRKTLQVSRSDGDRLSEEDKQARKRIVPQKLEKGIELGDEDYQIRAVVIGQRGSKLSADAESVIRVATWSNPNTGAGPSPAGQSGIGSSYGKAREFGRFAVAQAEYYYGGDESREEQMWHMKWRARLKRFRLPREDEAHREGIRRSRRDPEVGQWNAVLPGETLRDACSRATGGGACDEAENGIRLLDSLVVH